MLAGDNTLIPAEWIGRDGTTLQGRETVSELNHNLNEIRTLCQQAFYDAMQMGCSEEFMRIVLHGMVDSLKRNPNSQKIS